MNRYRLRMITMCLLAMMAASLSVKAQEVTITLMPGWTWISVPITEVQDFATTLGSFTPMTGDIIKSQWGNASYSNGQWRGNISQFYPGYGYMYKSTRTMPVTVTFNVQQPAPQVIVTTAEPTDITTNSATCGGNVVSTDGNYVFVILRGICWSTSPNPTFNENYVEVGNGLGSFTASMTDLAIGTTYYVRAFAVTANGTFYGEQKSFTTRDGIPLLTTADITNIGRHGAICGGNITDDGGLNITARGVCWSTSHNPTITDGHTVDGIGIGEYISYITGLAANTTYNVRAYATNSLGTVYGNELSIITDSLVPVGAINGLFTINANGDQVYFSQGNLQYQASTNTWKFADNQYDCIGSANSNISSTYSGWIDLFGWGTSGWNSGNTYYHPWDSYSWNGNLYGPPGQYNLTGSYANADWGVYNPISNGGNQTNQWRTLTQPEWDYVFNTRTITSGIRYAKANVNNVNGVIILPDDWSSSIYSLSSTNSSVASFSSNTLTTSQWSTLEQAGAVFLPAAGIRSGTSLNGVGSKGLYWSASYSDSDNAYYVYFYDSGLGTDEFGNSDRCYGRSVRLVQEY